MDSSAQTPKTVRSIGIRYATIAVLALALIVALGLVYAVRNGGSTQGLDLDLAPDFTTTLYSGGTGEFTLSAQQGHPVVLNFWASWCPPCLAEFPALQQAADQYKSDGLVVLGIDVQDNERDARQFLTEQGTTFLTGPDLDGQIAIDYALLGLPSTYFITRDGKIYRKWTGQIDEKNLTDVIDELLKL